MSPRQHNSKLTEGKNFPLKSLCPLLANQLMVQCLLDWMWYVRWLLLVNDKQTTSFTIPKMENSKLPNKEPNFPTPIFLCLKLRVKQNKTKQNLHHSESPNIPSFFDVINSFITSQVFICTHPAKTCCMQCFTHLSSHGLVDCVCWTRGQWD